MSFKILEADVKQHVLWENRCRHTHSLPYGWSLSTDSKIGHVLSRVSVDTLGGSSAEHCALPIATHEESGVGLFTDLASTLLATAAEKDVGRVEEGETSWSGLLCCCRHLTILNGNTIISVLWIMWINRATDGAHLAPVVKAVKTKHLIRYFCRNNLYSRKTGSTFDYYFFYFYNNVWADGIDWGTEHPVKWNGMNTEEIWTLYCVLSSAVDFYFEIDPLVVWAGW